MRRFDQAMAPLWGALHAILMREMPEIWTGYRCELQVSLDRAAGHYLVSIRFLDGTSNRAKTLASQSILDLASALHQAYQKFDAKLEWRKVTLKKYWDESQQQWFDRTEWEYGRTVIEPESGGEGSA